MEDSLRQRMKKYAELDAKRTQGEWELNDFYNKQNHYKPFYINAGEWEALAEVSGHMCIDYVDEARANAEFIASAPSMLTDLQATVRALEVAREALEGCYEVVEYPANGTTMQDKALQLINQTLGKAE